MCAEFHMQKVAQRQKDAERFGVPLIFSEFGACFNSLECYNEVTSSV